MTDNTPQAVPDITEEFRQRVNKIYESWHQNEISFPIALTQIEALRKEAIAEDNKLNEAGIYNILGIMYGYRSSYDDSIKNFDKARELFHDSGAIRRTATVDLNLGETYRLLGNFTRAKTYFRRAYEEAKTLEEIPLQVLALTNEGQMWFSLKSFDKARATLEKSLHISETEWHPENDREKINFADNACEIHHALVSVHLGIDNPEEAWEHAIKAFGHAEYSGRIVRMGYAYRALGDVITQLGESPDPDYNSDVDYYYDQAMSAFKQVKAEGEVAKTLLAQGQSLSKRGKKRSAGNKYQQAMVLFTRLGMMDSAAEAAQAQTETI
ncbi:MAG: hypothetical protein Phog2KO_37340 [Phototrophicaceae bacterium]